MNLLCLCSPILSFSYLVSAYIFIVYVCTLLSSELVPTVHITISEHKTQTIS